MGREAEVNQGLSLFPACPFFLPFFLPQNDPDETTNLYEQRPDKVKHMKALLETYKKQGRST